MTASYGPPALACSATCRMPAMLDRSPTTTAVAAGRAARASSALAVLRACSVTGCPSPTSSLAAISPRPSVEPVMNTRDISISLQAEAVCLAHLGEQVVAGAADGVDAEAGDDSPAHGWPGGRKGAELHQHFGGRRDGHRTLGFGHEGELPTG